MVSTVHKSLTISFLAVLIFISGLSADLVRVQLQNYVLAGSAPGGLANIVFAIIVLNKGVPRSEFMAMFVALTVFFSLGPHGVSANPLAK